MRANERTGPKRKVTVLLPVDLLEETKRELDLNTTEAIINGLKLLQATTAYAELRKLRGKVRFSIDLHSLRRDRR